MKIGLYFIEKQLIMKLLLLYKFLKNKSAKLLTEGMLEEYILVINQLENIEKKMKLQLLMN